MKEKFTIGDIAKNAGIGIETIRYDERRGLISPMGRTEGGYRIYDKDALSRLRFIKNAKEIGFTLKEIDELIRLGISSMSKCGDIRKEAEEKPEVIGEKMAVLGSIQEALKGLVSDC